MFALWLVFLGGCGERPITPPVPPWQEPEPGPVPEPDPVPEPNPPEVPTPPGG